MKTSKKTKKSKVEWVTDSYELSKPNKLIDVADKVEKEFMFDPINPTTKQKIIKFVEQQLVPKPNIDFKVEVKFVGKKNEPQIYVHSLNAYGQIFVEKMLGPLDIEKLQ